MAAAAQATHRAPPSAYPALGTAFPDLSSLSALVHSVHPTSPASPHTTPNGSADSPIDGTTASPPELIERRRGPEVSWTCKLGTRKPGRRRAGERRKSVEELCGFRLTAVRQSSSSTSSSSSSAPWVVTSFAPHVAAVHAQGWVASEAHDAAVRAGIVPPPPVVLPKRDGSGRFARSRSATSEEPGGFSLEGAVEGGDDSSPPPDTMRMKGGTLVPLVPLTPGLLGDQRVKPVRPRRDREHVGDGAWDAWRAGWAGESGEGEDEERRRARRKEERERVERLGGYGALRSWGWCEGLLEPLGDEGELQPVQQEIEHAVIGDVPPLEDDAALRRLVFEVVPSSFPPTPFPPPDVSSTQPRKRSSTTARLAPGRGGKRSRRAIDPEWLPILAPRSQRSATRAVAMLEDIAETCDEEEAQSQGGREADGDEEEQHGESTFSSPNDLPPLRQSSPVVHFASHLSSAGPIRSTLAALAPFTSSSRRASTASSTAPSPFSSPTASRDSFSRHDSTTTSDTSIVSSEPSQFPPNAAAAARGPTSLRPLRPRPPLAPILAAPPPPPQQHPKKSKQRRNRQAQPRARRPLTTSPGVHASASAAAAEAYASALEERSRLEDEAVWALVGMGRRASVGREGSAGGGALEPVLGVGAAAGGRGGQLWEREHWGV
ncbi:hypothetical protein JCM3775_004574 [Rhodotorula graminis]